MREELFSFLQKKTPQVRLTSNGCCFPSLLSAVYVRLPVIISSCWFHLRLDCNLNNASLGEAPHRRGESNFMQLIFDTILPCSELGAFVSAARRP